MSLKKALFLIGTLLVATVVLAACAGQPGPVGPAGPQGPAGAQGEPGPALTVADLSCVECHNDTTIITGHKTNWETSVHATGGGLTYAGERANCAGCHSGAVFSAMVAAGMNFTQVEANFADLDKGATHQDCRTCHQIHVTFTGDDWALETVAPVAFAAEAFAGVTYEGGTGNLCANCHQARRVPFVVENGTVNINTPRFNTHYGIEAQVLMGLGAIGVEGTPGAHYSMVQNTCVDCHMYEKDDHSFEAQLASCVACHSGAENFDINGYQTEIQAMLDELRGLLVAEGLLTEEGSTVQGVYPEAKAAALWNYNIFALQDTSLGVHNPAYVKAALTWSLEQMRP